VLVPRRACSADQPAILLTALARVHAAGRGAVAVFDLDSTLLDNRPRQAAILRAYGRSAGLPALLGARPEHVDGWDLAKALRDAGLDEPETRLHAGPFRQFWGERFFTSRYCRHDVPVPGAPEFVRAVRDAGVQIAYVTGRPSAAMRPGTLHVLGRFGFPLPDGAGVSLLMKPGAALADDAWKRLAREHVEGHGTPVLVLDNEPAHVNAYARAWPGALAIHLDTDHSGRPVEVAPSIPSVADLRLPDAVLRGLSVSAGGEAARAGAP
jgi:beta-phosphoglucomutase-like phosphatase (HAD superfamily)